MYFSQSGNNANDANDALTAHTHADDTLARDEAIKHQEHKPADLKLSEKERKQYKYTGSSILNFYNINI